MRSHRFAQQHAVFILLRGDARIIRMAELSEVIEGSAHIHFLFRLHIKQGQVQGASAAVSGMIADVSLREQHILLQLRIEIFLHPGILRILCPVDKIGDSALGPVSIIDLQTISLLNQVIAHLLQSLGSFLRQKRNRLLIAVDPVTDKVIGGIVTDLQNRIRHGFTEQNKIRGIIGERECLLRLLRLRFRHNRHPLEYQTISGMLLLIIPGKGEILIKPEASFSILVDHLGGVCSILIRLMLDPGSVLIGKDHRLRIKNAAHVPLCCRKCGVAPHQCHLCALIADGFHLRTAPSCLIGADEIHHRILSVLRRNRLDQTYRDGSCCQKSEHRSFLQHNYSPFLLFHNNCPVFLTDTPQR